MKPTSTLSRCPSQVSELSSIDCSIDPSAHELAACERILCKSQSQRLIIIRRYHRSIIPRSQATPGFETGTELILWLIRSDLIPRATLPFCRTALSKRSGDDLLRGTWGTLVGFGAARDLSGASEAAYQPIHAGKGLYHRDP